MEKKDIINKEPEFKVGEEVTCKVNGLQGYIVHSFKGCIVKFDKDIRVIPEDNLVQKEVCTYLYQKSLFQKGDHVTFLTIDGGDLKGVVSVCMRFYIVHFFKNGELKVLLAEILARGKVKIIFPVRDQPNQGISSSLGI